LVANASFVIPSLQDTNGFNVMAFDCDVSADNDPNKQQKAKSAHTGASVGGTIVLPILTLKALQKST